MKVAVFSTKPYDEKYLSKANKNYKHSLHFFESQLRVKNVGLAGGFQAICAFVNDDLSGEVLEKLKAGGTELIALRSAGFNHVDLVTAKKLGLTIARVPAYSPYAVAEHAMALILTLNRRTHRAYNRVREGNFSLDGLIGCDLYGKTAGIVGTGKIGQILAHILLGFGFKIVAYDLYPNSDLKKLGIQYVTLEELIQKSDIISLHCPLTPETHHLINQERIQMMKDHVMLINTGRGALIDTRAVIRGLKSGKIGYLGLDVYEEEEDLFFENLSDKVIQDDVFARLLTFPNVLITGHQAFLTHEALINIAETTLSNITAFETGKGTIHRVKTPLTPQLS